MALLHLSAPDIGRTILRPLVFDVIRDLKDKTFISPDTQIRYAGVNGALLQPGSEIGNPDKDAAQFGAQPAIDVSVAERLLEDVAANNNSYRTNSDPVFYDHALGVYVYPDYTFHEVQLTLKIRHQDLLQAERWRDELRYRLRAGRIVNIHRAVYSAHFPAAMFFILREIHRLRENVKGYGEDFRTYLLNHFIGDVGEVANLNGEQTALMYSEAMGGIQGWFEFPLTPENPEPTENAKNQEVSVTYVFQYDKLTSWIMDYPMSVHNQLLGPSFRRDGLPDKYNRVVQRRTYVNRVANSFVSGSGVESHQAPLDVVRIPDFDDFIPIHTLGGTRGLFSALVSLDSEDAGVPVLNFNEMGKHSLRKTILAFLKGESKFIHKRFGSVFQIAVYEGQTPFDTEADVRLTEDLDVVVNKPLDFRKQYRVVFSVVTDITLLDEDALERIRNFPPRDKDGNIIGDFDLDWDFPGTIIDLIYPGLKTCWGNDRAPTVEELRQLMWVVLNHRLGVQGHLITCEDLGNPDHDRDREIIHPRLTGSYGIFVQRIDPA